MWGLSIKALALAVAPAFDPAHATLDQVLEVADEAHVDIALARLQFQSAEQDARGAYAYILPRVDVGANITGTYNSPQRAYNVFPTTNANGQTVFAAQAVNLPGYAAPDFNFGVKAVQPLYDGGRWWTAIDKGKVDAHGAQANLEEARLKAHSDVAHAFYEVVRAGRQLDVLKSNVDRSQEQVERSEGLFEGGRGTKGDILAARVNLANDQIALLQQQATLDLDKTALNVVLGRAPKDPLEVAPPDLTQRPVVAPRDELQQRAEAHRPVMENLRAAAHSTRLGTRIAKADYYPAVSVAASYYRESPDPTLVAGNPARQFIAQGSVNLAWNVFEGHSTDVAVQKASLAEQEADATLEKARRDLSSQVEHAVRAMEAASASETLSELARKVSAEGLEVANERFRLGSANTLEVRDAQIKLTQAELALVGTQIDLQLAGIDVRAAIGEL